MEETTQSKGYASIAQAIRCDGLVTAGTITKEVFERDLLATDLESIPWRKGPAKEGDGNPEVLAGLLMRKATLQRVQALAPEKLDAVANDDEHPDQDAAQQEVYRRSLPKDPGPQAGSAEAAGIGVLVVALIVILGCGYLLKSYRCHSKADKMGFGSTYGPIDGCMIKTPAGWIDMEKYRYMGD